MAGIIVVGDPNQAIYGFTGASCASMDELKAMLHAEEFHLSTCFRIKNLHIIRLLQEYEPTLQPPDDAYEGKPIEWFDRFEQILDAVTPGDTAILSRTNAPLIEMYFKLLKMQIPSAIRGRDDSREIISLYRECMTGCKTMDDLLASVETWKFQAMAKAKRNQVKIERIDNRVTSLLAVLQNSSMYSVEQQIDLMFSDTIDARKVVLSSSHKSKGLEWRKVFLLRGIWRETRGGAKLIQQFPHPLVTQAEFLKQEDNLLFVAQSRAQHELDFFNFESEL